MRKQLRAVLVTACATTLLWSVPYVFLEKQMDRSSKEMAQLKEDNSLVADKDVIQIARTVKNSDYSYEEYVVGYNDQVVELEASVQEKKDEIDLLRRQIKKIKKTYTNKLGKSEIPKYHLTNGNLSKAQLEKADDIAYIVASNYEDYGVLPSVAVGQAMQESSLGKDCPENNLWGISIGGYAPFSSLKEGVITYLGVINNGAYDNALFNSSYSSSLVHIQNGGYCEPRDGYASNVIQCVDKFGFKAYDNYYLGK